MFQMHTVLFDMLISVSLNSLGELSLEDKDLYMFLASSSICLQTSLI